MHLSGRQALCHIPDKPSFRFGQDDHFESSYRMPYAEASLRGQEIARPLLLCGGGGHNGERFLWGGGGGASPGPRIAGSAPGGGAAWRASEGGFDGGTWSVVGGRAVGVGLGRADTGCVFLAVGLLKIGSGWGSTAAATGAGGSSNSTSLEGAGGGAVGALEATGAWGRELTFS